MNLLKKIIQEVFDYFDVRECYLKIGFFLNFLGIFLACSSKKYTTNPNRYQDKYPLDKYIPGNKPPWKLTPRDD